MLAARATGSHGARPAAALAAAASRASSRAFSAKPPDKPKPTPEEEEAKKVAQMRALDVVLEAQNNTVSPPMYSTRDEPFPENPEEALALDPLPPTVAGRKVIIAQKSKPATTTGTAGGLYGWNLTFKQKERWSNPLMGWTSTGDPMSNMQLSFSTPEQAVKFCQKRGWKYEVKAPAKREAVFGKFAYSHNFLPHNVEHDLKVNGTKTQQFTFPTAGASHYERPLNFVGTAPVRQHGNPEQK
ncbi:NADH dehydrogenase (ubiquinone) [Ectocarpus siliculosus]|uniref:NADH dehydrogenase [ubiquinone] iron-sulfur protein 4, mitochondrial n=1 Tax=Ectocarpus siliculosus TaxID=2880 RepID=D7FUB1_ECTSI|nr:NADH dehydrogenase (ubiquinone) [Ectocarpus siliculosus]|eukprot:CBJ26181.1 NADH dehydrogenase (ubiquinone) [Ectocarpus siliculosus]